MNSMPKSSHAFIESVCAELGCRELARPLREGFSVLCEASRRNPLTPEKLAEFHELVTETVKPIVSRINRFLKPCGLSIVPDYSDKAREHFEDEPHHVAAIMHSLQDEGSPVAPVAINEPMIARYYYGTWHEDDYALEHCLSDSLWHEAGHHIVDAANGILLIRDLPDDEDIVESFGRYMTEKTLGYDSDYDSEMVNTAIGAATLLKICNSGTYSKASLKKAMAFVGNEFTEQELAEWLQESGVQEKAKPAAGGNTLQEGISALTEAGANRQSMPLPEEFQNTIVEGFKYAIRYGFISRHAMEYQDRHGDMWSYQKSHAIAMRLLDAIKQGNPDVAMIAGPYLMYEDGSVRYQAYATLDWKNVIKIISTNTIFPPANPPKLKVWTCFCCDDPNEANKWVKKLAASAGKTLEPTNDGGTHKKSAHDVARSRGKFIYDEIVRKLSEQYKTDIAPLVRELMQEIYRPAGQRDMGKVAELSNKVRGIYAERSELVKQRDQYAWKLFHRRPTDTGERHFAPLSPEELENCVTELYDLNVERAGILNNLSMVKSKLAELQAMPEDEIDRGMLGSLLKEKQEITEQRFRIEEKEASCRDRLLGGREGHISFGK